MALFRHQSGPRDIPDLDVAVADARHDATAVRGIGQGIDRLGAGKGAAVRQVCGSGPQFVVPTRVPPMPVID